MVLFLTKIEMKWSLSFLVIAKYSNYKADLSQKQMMPMKTASKVVVRSLPRWPCMVVLIATTPYSFSNDLLLYAIFKYKSW